MKYSSKTLSQTVVQLCLAKGIDRIVISPGSRNAPLTIGFTAHGSFHCYSVVDERCAAFFALGMAQQYQKPVALVCTSGSALLNYYPAIAEAYYSDIPLVVLSADRPSDLIDIGDGQTIRQENVYANHIEYSANCKEGISFQEFNEAEINRALNIALQKKGPVHINLPFSEPLYERQEIPSVTPRSTPLKVSFENLTEQTLHSLQKTWKQSAKKMILVGTLPPNSVAQKWIDLVAEDPSVLVLTETTSNLHHPKIIPAIDTLISTLSEEAFAQLKPNILLTFGGMVVSKRIKAFLREYPPEAHWHIDPKKALNTYFSLTEHIAMPPNSFFEAFLQKGEGTESDYQEQWLGKWSYRRLQQAQFEKSLPHSDFKVYHSLFDSIPNQWMLQLANSTAIRYSQLFEMNPSLAIFCNRGTSGIDGSTSTAIGAALASNKPTLLVTGDLSFFYDSNALWNQYIPKNFRMVVVNNSGGGIFRILPKAQEVAHFTQYFETKHSLTAKHLCKTYHIDYSAAKNEEELREVLTDFFKEGDAPRLLEVFTPSEVNDLVLKQYFKAIS